MRGSRQSFPEPKVSNNFLGDAGFESILSLSG